MTNTTLTDFERDLLRHLDEIDRNLDPCVPVPWDHFEQLVRALLRKGLIVDFYWTSAEGDGPCVTDAGRALLAELALPPLPRVCFAGCDRA